MPSVAVGTAEALGQDLAVVESASATQAVIAALGSITLVDMAQAYPSISDEAISTESQVSTDPHSTTIMLVPFVTTMDMLHRDITLSTTVVGVGSLRQIASIKKQARGFRGLVHFAFARIPGRNSYFSSS